MKTARSGSRKRAAAAPELAAPAAEADAEPIARAADAPQYQTFTVRFLLDPQGDCRRTEVTHIQLGVSEAWPGYDPARLDAWIAAHIGARAAGPAQHADTAAAPAPEPAPAPLDLTPAPHDLELLPAGAGVHAGAPVTARLALDLAGGAAAGVPVDYLVTTYARMLGGGHAMLGEARGQALTGATTVVEVPGVAPQPGIYRLGATVTLARAQGHAESLSGTLFHVYEGGENR